MYLGQAMLLMQESSAAAPAPAEAAPEMSRVTATHAQTPPAKARQTSALSLKMCIPPGCDGTGGTAEAHRIGIAASGAGTGHRAPACCGGDTGGSWASCFPFARNALEPASKISGKTWL